MGRRELSLVVVGVQYPNVDKSNRQFEVAVCRPGDRVHLVPEPRNKHDRRAVAVISERGVQLGYLSAERCAWIGGIINAGEEVNAIFQQAGDTVAYIRVAIGGGEPTLPPPFTPKPRWQDGEEADQRPAVDWYPDEA